MNTKGLLIPFMFSTVLFLEANISNNNVSNNIIEGSAYGAKVVTENKLESVFSKTQENNNYKAEIIYSWQKFLNTSSPYQTEVLGTSKPLVVALKKEEASLEKNTEDKVEEVVVVKGFCYIPQDINVGKQPSSIRTDCKTNVGNIIMFANLVNVNEKASLIADPRYIELKGVRFNVVSSIVTNESKTSYNIATFVNDRKIANIGWSSLSVSADEVKNSTNEYLQALRESQTKEEVQYVSVTDGAGNSYMQPVQIQNTEKPDPLDYLIDAGINIVASTVKTTADIFKADLPYLYQIAGKSKIWIDLKVNKKGELVK